MVEGQVRGSVVDLTQNSAFSWDLVEVYERFGTGRCRVSIGTHGCSLRRGFIRCHATIGLLARNASYCST